MQNASKSASKTSAESNDVVHKLQAPNSQSGQNPDSVPPQLPTQTVALAISSRRERQILYDQEDFSDEEVDHWMEELEDAYDMLDRAEERKMGDIGYYSENEE